MTSTKNPTTLTLGLIEQYPQWIVEINEKGHSSFRSGLDRISDEFGVFKRSQRRCDQSCDGSTVEFSTWISSMYEKLSDDQLVEQYVKAGNQEAISALINRHYDNIYRRLFRKLRNTSDAEDCCQTVWLKLEVGLPKFEGQGKFAHYLAKIATNVLNDFWEQSGVRDKVTVDDFLIDNVDGESPSLDRHVDSAEELKYVVGTVIPSLPVGQRMAWLLYHESIFWEPSLPLSWDTLATLNGMDADTARAKFESARDSLVSSRSEGKASNLDDEALLIFLVWTQANRANKTQKYTWDYFAELLGIPPATLKTRYSEAKKHINRCVESRRESGNV